MQKLVLVWVMLTWVTWESCSQEITRSLFLHTCTVAQLTVFIVMHSMWRHKLCPEKCIIVDIICRIHYSMQCVYYHCKKGNVSLTCSLSFWMQMSEQITHMDSDNYYSGMRMRRGTRYERGKVCYEVPLCKWFVLFTHLQPEWHTACQTDSSLFTVCN